MMQMTVHSPRSLFVSRCATLLCAAVFAAPGVQGQALLPTDPRQIEWFEKQVRPILAAHCYGCHGPVKQMNGLRVDSRQALLAGGDSGPAVIPGIPDDSLLIRAVRREGDLQMPPDEPLAAEAIEVLAEWVRRGVPCPEAAAQPATHAWQSHWAFQPVSDPPLPEVSQSGWCHTSVDRFILASLESAGLAPSPPADRRTLLRRACYALTGLPPDPQEVAAFEEDVGPDAFEQLVDRLLASPQFGERWGRHWLDVARFADTKGYVFFQDSNFPWAYTYRDYVIRAFNTDLPYNQFLREQIAADALVGEDRRALAALGFLTLGGRFMNNQHDIIDDRIDVVTRGLLGLTVSCARCHDHKYDPIPTADYYSLYGVFASSMEPTVPPTFEPPPRTDEYAAFESELAKREQALRAFVDSKYQELVSGARLRADEYMLAAHAASRQPDTEEFMLLADGSDLNPKMLQRWRLYLERARRRGHPVFVPWHALGALSEAEFASKGAELIAGWQTDAGVNRLVAKRLAEAGPRDLQAVAACYGELFREVVRAWEEAQAAATAAGMQVLCLPEAEREQIRQVLYASDAPPSVPYNPMGDLELLPDRPSQAKLQELVKAVEEWRVSGPGAPPRAMVLVDRPQPVEPYIFVRGSPGNRGPSVPRQFLRVLAGESRQPFTHGSGRLELAEAIVDLQNPLTARVWVNRVWLHLFGRGLVGTPGDFGLRSDPPTHPALLDHLAYTFVREGWSTKALIRRILLSATWQQASADRAECRVVDAENRLWWRMERRRLDYESMRDTLLAVSGRLDRTLGGPSVQLYSPPFSGRRSLYGFVDRLNVPGLLRTFDFPSPDATSPKRDETSVPPQALFLMNHPLVQELAEQLVQRTEVANAPDLPGKVRALYWLIYGRLPSEDEILLAARYLGLPQESAGRWPWYAQALLMSNELMFVD